MVGKVLSDVEKAPTNLRGFIRHCHRENVGWLALALCIAGADEFEVMSTFFDGVPYKDKRIRKDVQRLDLFKLKDEMQSKGVTQKMLAKAIGRKQTIISRMFQFGARWCNKSRSFVADCEKALGLKKGELIYKEDI